jgi:hypothetical protein
MQECTSRYFIALAFAKRSPYTAAFTVEVVRLIESGIVQHCKERYTHESANSTVSRLFEKDGRKNTRPEVLRLEHVQGAFLLLAAGVLMCILVFIAELSINRIAFKDNHNEVIYVWYDNIVSVHFLTIIIIIIIITTTTTTNMSSPKKLLFLLFLSCKIREINIITGKEHGPSYKVCCCLLQPSVVVFHCPVAGFSLLGFEVS